MPGYITHYLFGRESYHRITSAAFKHNISRNHAAYTLGQQGPDIFFYFLPSYCIHSSNIGALAHRKETNAFFRGLFLSCQRFTGDDLEIAKAYLAGFMGHYTLDTICHPYVYARTDYEQGKGDYFSRHAYLETDIDTKLLYMKLHRRPGNFRAADTIKLTFRQRRVIARMLNDAYHYAFPNLAIHPVMMLIGIFSMQLGLALLHDDSGQKKVFYRLIEKHLIGYPVFSPLVASNQLYFRTDPFNLQGKAWTNPWDETLISNETFFDLYQKAQKKFLSRMKRLSVIFYDSTSMREKEEQLKLLLKEYGNLSFHSGLDASIPS